MINLQIENCQIVVVQCTYRHNFFQTDKSHRQNMQVEKLNTNHIIFMCINAMNMIQRQKLKKDTWLKRFVCPSYDARPEMLSCGKFKRYALLFIIPTGCLLVSIFPPPTGHLPGGVCTSLNSLKCFGTLPGNPAKKKNFE